MDGTRLREIEERYDIYTAAAWIKGCRKRTGLPDIETEIWDKPLAEMTAEEMAVIVEAGQKAEWKLYPFKKGTQELPRVKRVIGFLRSLSFESMLDVGSGRGVFLIPFMRAFPWVKVTSVDLLENRITFLNDLKEGGFSQLTAIQGNICRQPFPDQSFDVVSMLEVLEHIPDVESAVAAGVRMAKQYVVVSVPSKPDDNPEHIHLLTRDILTELFQKAGCSRLHFDGVEGHLILVAAV